METPYYILDVPLPLSQDFVELKELGLEYIQRHSGTSWSNLNTSDPGVTILDQVCYALTELGYVNDFSMADILTRRDGKLEIKDQFYRPEELLTTSPVTPDDYRKYVIDGIAAVKNAVIVPVTDASPSQSGMYNVYLQVDESMIISPEAICSSVFFYLNKRRNLNEFFSMPQLLHKELYRVGGKIEITKSSDLNKILTEINEQARNFIFPDVVPQSYDSLSVAGLPTNEIFNGPLLLHGWIPTAALGTKKEELQVFELVDMISIIPGVSGVSGLTLSAEDSPEGTVSSSPEGRVYTVDVYGSFDTGTLEVYCDGKRIMPGRDATGDSVLGKSLKATTNIQFGAVMNVQTELPKGRFRKIESYYSIQNTFPEIYAVGADAVDSDAPDFQISQSRQLKGYLTLFDQVLANQFSQLANLDRLFSFKNAMTDNGIDFSRRHHVYPAPYKTFSPTYFYQPLYEVPHIRSLLKNNQAFNFGNHFEPEKIRQEKSWKEYMLDPYNPYIRGLMDFMEDEKNSVQRRNEILDHLLAQNGESPYVMDQVMDALLYTGDAVKGQIIFKSLYLQNLGLLSYFRQKGYNYMGAIKIDPQIHDVNEHFEEHILGSTTKDFIFSSRLIDKLEKLKIRDFINYSTLELKLFLVFGLRIQYLNYISANYSMYHIKEEAEKMNMAQWMILQRRGVIAIETGLLFRFGGDRLLHLQEEPVFHNKVILFFPSFIPSFAAAEFRDRLQLFCESTVPVQVPVKSYFIGVDELLLLSKLFSEWHNELVYNDKHKDYNSNTTLAVSAEMLALYIMLINDIEHAGDR